MPLRMGRVNQIYYWPVLWYSSVEAGKGDIIMAWKRGCATKMEFMLKFLGPRGAAVHHITAPSVTVHHSSKECHK